MYNSSILVLLYNKEISESPTLNSILSSDFIFTNSHLVIWNNGPLSLRNLDTDKLCRLGLTVDIIQTLDNIPLSVVYNKFIDKFKSDKYVILDDDSTVNKKYLTDALSIGNNEIGLPIIECMRDVKSPIINGNLAMKTGIYSNNDCIIAIGSGMVLGHDVLMKIKNTHGTIFDERFILYGVDVTFCYRVNKTCFDDLEIHVISGFAHALSKMSDEEDNISNFRRKERSYDLGLRLKYYYSGPKKLAILFKAVIFSACREFIPVKNKYDAKSLIKAFYSGKHYKS